MRLKIWSGVIALSVIMPVAAYAQGAATGAAAGAVGGAVVGGPVGAAVGAGVGAIVGGISDANRPRFHDYVVREHITSYPYAGQVVVGTELPGTITYYDVPAEYGVKNYRYTVVNNTAVLVDPRTHRIVEIIG
jgi:Protein of unknown function (DUF1236)/Glycine zipper